MIVKTGMGLRGAHTYGLVAYLLGPGRTNEHVEPRVIAGWMPQPWLNLPGRSDGRPGHDVRGLVTALDEPVRAAGDRAPARYVFHTVISNRDSDPQLTDAQWADVAYDLMRELGLAGTEQGQRDIRWVAIRHDEQHIHLAGTLIRADGTVAHTPQDFAAAAVVRARMEARYGLAATNTGDRTASIRPQRAEQEKAARQDRPETERETVRRVVRSAAAASTSGEQFRAELIRSGLRFEPRYSVTTAGQITGYKVSLLPTRSGGDTVWFAGGGLDRDLTWPKLTARWAPPDVRGAGDRTPPQPERTARAAAPAAENRAAVSAAQLEQRVAVFRRAAFTAAADTAVLRGRPEAVDSLAAGAVDLAAATARAWQVGLPGRAPLAGVTRAADTAQRAGRSIGGAGPRYDARAAAMRRAVRGVLLAGQLSSGSDTAAWLALATQVAAMLDAVAAARAAQNRVDQAAAARDAAARYRIEIALAVADPAAAGASPRVLAAARRPGGMAPGFRSGVDRDRWAGPDPDAPRPPTPPAPGRGR